MDSTTLAPLTKTLEYNQTNSIPNIRRIRNALLQVWIQWKIAALFNPHIPKIKGNKNTIERRNLENSDRRQMDRWNNNTIWRRETDIKVLSIITSITLEEIIKLIELDTTHHTFLVHEQSVIWWSMTIREIQNQWHTVSFVAEDWRTTWRYIIEKKQAS